VAGGGRGGGPSEPVTKSGLSGGGVGLVGKRRAKKEAGSRENKEGVRQKESGVRGKG